MHPFSEKLMKNEKTFGLVKKLSPIELMKSLVYVADLLPSEAAIVVKELGEGLSGGSIETNMEFPVPPVLKKENGPNLTPKHDFQRHHFPPDPRAEPKEWPFDDATVQGIDPKNKGSKRPLFQSADKEKERVTKLKFKSPLDVDFRSGQPGGDAGASGIYSKSFHSRDNSTPSQGRSWSKQGHPGWSRSLSGNDFDPPERKIKIGPKAELPEDKHELPGNEIEMFKNEPVGSSIPQFKPGTNPGRLSKAGHRGYGRR